MINYHGFRKNAPFFEGWYLKHQNTTQTLALIPGVHMANDGKKSAFLQIVTDRGSYHIPYPYGAFRAARNQFAVTLGENIFTPKGAKLCVNTPEVSCNGVIGYNSFTPPAGDVMGYFRHFPWMPCSHGILSLYHNLCGKITLNGVRYDFTNGVGYLEKDWGVSFPKRYFWIHCNQFERPEKCSVTVSIAELPTGLHGWMPGCLCSILWQGQEYRMATYNGAKIVAAEKDCVILRRGKNVLKVTVDTPVSHPLLAPVNGDMTRQILESPACSARFILYHDGAVVFDLHSGSASYEFAE